MRLALTALICAADAFLMPSIKKGSALKATGDRWYCGEGVKYPRGAAGMPPSPPPETGGYSHEQQLFDFWADTNYDYEVALARPLGIVFEEIGTAAQPRGGTAAAAFLLLGHIRVVRGRNLCGNQPVRRGLAARQNTPAIDAAF